MPVLSKHKDGEASSMLTIEVASDDAAFLQNLLKGELQRTRALVEISNLRKQAGNKNDTKAAPRPLLEKLGQYPAEGVNLDNIVTYPPKLEPIPVKPLFLDIAWNYIQYPTTQTEKAMPARNKSDASKQPEPAPKKGWFGFGRG